MHQLTTLFPQMFHNIMESVDLTCSERFRGSVPLLPVLRPYHGYWIARKPTDEDNIIDEVDEEAGDSLDTSR